ncbi:sensor histidine kinase [Halomonas sp. MCCC 1A17488]|uniref:sensor histidine kinase n=1 Tax=unclassified Halomonas TaxID=2609666 RepID=UPI0018D254FE|nr:MULTISPECIES: sensor histidine kinase [unclassified Halomonas]MCE8015997.1 sensor histidine kinase [Halomonas sp. MCCC 1A17488]MCG3239330.1 sensor histidine kinase [Halomonas sp. MCCC 1A17488]QPP50740.1 sensor histidine kinase [Halomonas sp. SS10-MC5]
MSLRRVDRRSLRFRLLAWLGGVAFIVVGLTWLMHGILLHDLARSFLGERLRQEAEHTLLQFRQGQLSTPLWRAESPAFQVFHHLYVLELDGEITTSHPRWLEALVPFLEGEDDTLDVVAWGGRHLLVYRARFEFDGRSGVLLIGEDFGQVEDGLEVLHWWVGGIAGLLLVLLIGLNMMAVNRALRPLSRLRRQLDELRAGARDRLHLDAPSELDGLVEQLNRLMDEHARRLQRSRESLANLSHALKTPLTAILQVLRGSRPIDAERRLKMQRRLEDMHAQLETELKRSRIAGPNAGQRAVVRREAEQLIEMFSSLYPDRRFRLDIAAAVPATVSVERQDFAEMLGILLDNAGKWASREIHCHLHQDASLTILVEDDGRGVAPGDLSRLGRRGNRLDEGKPGHGLGLSILHQIVERYAGRVRFEPSPVGGLRVEIVLPLPETN